MLNKALYFFSLSKYESNYFSFARCWLNKWMVLSTLKITFVERYSVGVSNNIAAIKGYIYFVADKEYYHALEDNIQSKTREIMYPKWYYPLHQFIKNPGVDFQSRFSVLNHFATSYMFRISTIYKFTFYYLQFMSYCRYYKQYSNMLPGFKKPF